jgi:hypothetical protein
MLSAMSKLGGLECSKSEGVRRGSSPPFLSIRKTLVKHLTFPYQQEGEMRLHGEEVRGGVSTGERHLALSDVG